MNIYPIRKSQLIFNPGPGAIVETSDWSGVVSSIAEWDTEKLQRMPRKRRRGFQVLLRPQ